MEMSELPKPVAAVLERGVGIREFRTWPDGHAFLDTWTPWQAEPELVREIFKHKDEVLHLQDELWDALLAEAEKGCLDLDYILAAALIDGKLVTAAWLYHEEAYETEEQNI
jgi:hypothetical protein